MTTIMTTPALPHPLLFPVTKAPEPAAPSSREAAFVALAWIEDFVTLAQQALASDDDEDERRRCEDELLKRVPYLRAAGVFEMFEIRHPALRSMVDECSPPLRAVA